MNDQPVINREQIARHISSKHLVLLPDGGEVPLDCADRDAVEKSLDAIGNPHLRSYVMSEEIKDLPGVEPPSIKAMQRLELVGYERSSDSGNLRLYPKGHLIFELLCDWAREIAVNRFGAMQIESPLLYNWADPEIREQAGSFHERHYVVRVPDDPDKELILRFAGDFGLFKIMQQARFSHRMLPLRIYEFSKSFRYEKAGALSGLKRLRAFHMPDIHCFCGDLDQAWDEYRLLYRNYADLADGAGVAYAVCFRIVDDFYRAHKPRIVELLEYSRRPAFIELLSGMKHYWAVKHEFQAIDSVGGNVQLSTVQLDIKDAAVYGIEYAGADGRRRPCVICHSSVGSIERWMFAVLEEALKKPRPALPLWLSPSQLRLVPVNGDLVRFCESLRFDGVRVEIDDHDDPVGRKIARAGVDWAPYVVVVGPQELESGRLMVGRRSDGLRRPLSADEIGEEIRNGCRGMPWRPLPMAKMLSLRPAFGG